MAGVAIEPTPNPSGIESITITIQPIQFSSPPQTYVIPRANSLSGPLSTNWSATVGLVEGLNTVTVVATDYAGNRSQPVTIQATYRPIDPVNDFFVNAIQLSPTNGISSVNTIRATKEIGEPNHAGSFGGHSAWWKFTPASDGILTVSTTNSTFDTVMAIYTGNTVGGLTNVASNDDAFDGAPGG